MTNFAQWPAWAARALLAAMAGLVILAALPQGGGKSSATYDDKRLYRAVTERVMAGQDYYPAAAAEHRAHGYPTAPAQVFRAPTLAWVTAALGTDTVRRTVLIGLSLAALLALHGALVRAGVGARTALWSMPLVATAFAISTARGSIFLHEVWAGALIALSLAAWRPGRWGAAVALGFAACLFRELALPYLWAMAAFALWDRRWRELAAWVAATGVFIGLFALHLHRAAAEHLPGDIVSAGWVRLGGWTFVLETARRNLMLIWASAPVVAFAVCLGLLGLAGWRSGWTGRAALVVGGYMAAFAVVGRPDNAYWGILYAPLLPLGWLLAPAALRDLASRALPRRAPAKAL